MLQISRWHPPVSCPLGEMLLATNGETLVGLDYVEYRERFEALLAKAGFVTQTEPAAAAPPVCVTDCLERYFAGELSAIDGLAVAYGGTEFQNAVWRKLREIPAGETWTYGQLAAVLDNPKAVRAVGRTNGLNPVAIVGPCHRVVGANGTLTGYAGGLERKRWLLDHEARHASGTLL